jgi:hypothetical protein
LRTIQLAPIRKSDPTSSHHFVRWLGWSLSLAFYLIEGIRGAATISAKYSADTKKGNELSLG